jgi:hypothetical protein
MENNFNNTITYCRNEDNKDLLNNYDTNVVGIALGVGLGVFSCICFIPIQQDRMDYSDEENSDEDIEESEF